MKKRKNAKKSDSKAHPNEGQRLLNVRKKAGLSQRKFASKFGVSPGTVANYENAETELPPSVWRPIKKEYGANVAPEDPETEPHLIYREMAETERQLTSSEQPESDVAPQLEVAFQRLPQRFFNSVRTMRKRSEHLKEEVYSPLRRRLHAGVDMVYFTAVFSFGNEYIRRNFFPSEVDPGFYRDFIFVSSAVLIGQMGLVCLINPNAITRNVVLWVNSRLQ